MKKRIIYVVLSSILTISSLIIYALSFEVKSDSYGTSVSSYKPYLILTIISILILLSCIYNLVVFIKTKKEFIYFSSIVFIPTGIIIVITSITKIINQIVSKKDDMKYWILSLIIIIGITSITVGLLLYRKQKNK